MRLDKPIQPDVQAVLNAAAMLDITEYDLFRIAYVRWHGEVPDTRTMEPFFVAYMFNEIVPLWVRHFARLVERLNRLGRLDPQAFGIERLPATRQMARQGVRIGVTIAAIVTVLIVLAEVAAQVLGLGDRCFFPPCY